MEAGRKAVFEVEVCTSASLARTRSFQKRRGAGQGQAGAMQSHETSVTREEGPQHTIPVVVQLRHYCLTLLNNRVVSNCVAALPRKSNPGNYSVATHAITQQTITTQSARYQRGLSMTFPARISWRTRPGVLVPDAPESFEDADLEELGQAA